MPYGKAFLPIPMKYASPDVNDDDKLLKTFEEWYGLNELEKDALLMSNSNINSDDYLLKSVCNEKTKLVQLEITYLEEKIELQKKEDDLKHDVICKDLALMLQNAQTIQDAAFDKKLTAEKELLAKQIAVVKNENDRVISGFRKAMAGAVGVIGIIATIVAILVRFT